MRRVLSKSFLTSAVICTTFIRAGGDRDISLNGFAAPPLSLLWIKEGTTSARYRFFQFWIAEFSFRTPPDKNKEVQERMGERGNDKKGADDFARETLGFPMGYAHLFCA